MASHSLEALGPPPPPLIDSTHKSLQVSTSITIPAQHIVGTQEQPKDTPHAMEGEEVFTMATKVEDWCEDTLDAFTQHLTSGADSALCRLRMVFAWVATNIAYDVDSFLNHSHAPTDGAGWSALRSRKATCSGYADLLQRMCRSCGIACVKIRGYAKGVGYVPGHAFTALIPNHEWNAIQLWNRWYLLDVCWSAGYLRQASDTFIFKLTDHYFLSDPKVFGLDHHPLDPTWQLLPAPRTLQQFETSVHLKQGFFQYAISTVCPEIGVLEVNNGEVDVTLEFAYPLELTYELRHVDSGCEYSKCVCFKISASSAQFLIRPVVLGTHTFKVYAKLKGCREEPISLTTHTLQVETASQKLLPSVDMRFPWGPTRHLAEFGLTEVGPSCSCLTPEGKKGYHAVFTCTDARVSLTPILYNLGGDTIKRCQLTLDTCKLSEDRVGHSRHITITVKPPEKSHYWLCIYASLYNDAHDSSKKCVSNLLVCSLPALPSPVPEYNTRWRHECAAAVCFRDETTEFVEADEKSDTVQLWPLKTHSGELFSFVNKESVLDMTTISRWANVVLEVCIKIKQHSQQGCVRLIHYLIE